MLPLTRVHGGIDRVDAGVHRRQHRGRRDAAGVVGVEVDRQADLLLERRDQLARRVGLAAGPPCP